MKPGMSAEVEIILARHDDVVSVPAAACIETNDGFACWVQRELEVERRSLTVGDSNDMFLLAEEGVEEGERVILNPLANVQEAQDEAAQLLEESDESKSML